jgi:deoxyribodipyrimidine photo-lyase
MATGNGQQEQAAMPHLIFNPESQQKKFDPKAIYIRKWVTEFDELSYPLPIVDHKYARERCLKTFKEGLA